MLERVITGGQTGVDIAALRAAAACCLRTGGTMPRGFRTHGGPRPAWAREFGLRESPIDGYLARTFVNVIDSQATLRLAEHFGSPGMRATWSAIVAHQRPHADVVLYRSRSGLYAGRAMDLESHQAEVHRVAAWILEEQIGVLNVAGNAEEHAPGIEAVAKAFLIEVFELVD